MNVPNDTDLITVRKLDAIRKEFLKYPSHVRGIALATNHQHDLKEFPKPHNRYHFIYGGMKTKKVCVRFDELHNRQRLYLSDGYGIWEVEVGQKRHLRHETLVILAVSEKDRLLPYQLHPAKDVFLLEGEHREEVLKKHPDSNIGDDVVLYSVIYRHTEVARTFYIKAMLDPKAGWKFTLGASQFDPENTSLRLFRSLKQAVTYTINDIDRNDVDTGIDIIPDLYSDISRYTIGHHSAKVDRINDVINELFDSIWKPTNVYNLHDSPHLFDVRMSGFNHFMDFELKEDLANQLLANDNSFNTQDSDVSHSNSIVMDIEFDVGDTNQLVADAAAFIKSKKEN